MLDGVVTHASDMTFELLHRRDTTDTEILSFANHFDPKPGTDLTATPFATDQDGVAAPWSSGDLLVFRYSITNPVAAACWSPNGDGPNNGGEIPSITLPK